MNRFDFKIQNFQLNLCQQKYISQNYSLGTPVANGGSKQFKHFRALVLSRGGSNSLRQLLCECKNRNHNNYFWNVIMLRGKSQSDAR